MTAPTFRPVGRPPVALADLVGERRFNSRNRRHRAALLAADDEQEFDHPAARELHSIARTYRSAAGTGERGRATKLARLFEQTVRRA